MSSRSLLTGRGGVDCERVHISAKLVGQRLIDQTVALEAGLPFEGTRYNMNAEMRLTPRPMSGVPCM